MAYFSSVKDVVDAGERYACHCASDGKCSGCGECCTDLLPMSEVELCRIRAYARRHGLSEHRHTYFFDRGATDLTCPFRNETTKKCDIYSVRPEICRTFICSKPLEQVKAERDSIHRKNGVHSLRWEIFGNNETLRFLAKFTMHK